MRFKIKKKLKVLITVAQKLSALRTGHNHSCNVSASHRTFLPYSFPNPKSIAIFSIAVLEDPMKKREQFAISLRKEKTKKILTAKRLKLI